MRFPCDKSIPTTGNSNAIKLWKSFVKAEIDLKDYPRIPKHYFSKDPIFSRVSELFRSQRVIKAD
ncbi:hypothetical protein N7478_007721 [Penicillium angulare]|uniref:uncharacterized protein n=1 Tax=Penicillium angulare TaxID=116970 RepID=UPI002540232B|nr:uncharacterized protein N7478_007721 [Penicillium angulare]KAJ5272596.1 hypothetical protein N7478_007721 [Penicillium angulare]